MLGNYQSMPNYYSLPEPTGIKADSTSITVPQIFDDSVYEDIRLEDNRKPTFELRKGKDKPTKYYSSKYLKTFSRFGKFMNIFGPISTFIEYLFPSEEQEKILELENKFKYPYKPELYSNGTNEIK